MEQWGLGKTRAPAPQLGEAAATQHKPSVTIQHQPRGRKRVLHTGMMAEKTFKEPTSHLP